MKNTISIMILIIGSLSIAQAQAARVSTEDPHWCSGCSPAEKQQIADRVNKGDPSPRLTGGSSDKGESVFGARPRTDTRPPYVLRAHFLVKNESDKKIKRVIWEYTISNRETKAFIQTLTFVTEKTIAPRKSAVLKQKVRVPMAKLLGGTVPAGQAGQKRPPTVEVEENYRIKEIKYADGTVHAP